MPEGDTIHRAADRLRPALEGQPLVAFATSRPVARAPRPGTVVERVRAEGKHLLVDFADGSTLRTHLRMNGVWHLYRTGERWRKPAHLARVRLEVPGWVAVCFSAPVVEVTGRGRAAEAVAHLGPDLCRADTTDDDLLACARRMADVSEPGTTIAEALLDQRVANGVGNVFKSEVLHAHQLDPFVPVHDVPLALRHDLLRTAARLLRSNLGTGRRTTVGRPGAGGLAVYGRRRSRCRRCGSPIRSRLHGRQPRRTWWCPGCQVAPTGSPSADPERPR